MFAAIGNILFVLIVLLGLLIVPLGMPGTWAVVVAAFIYSFFDDFHRVPGDWLVLLVLVILAVLAELLEFGIQWVGGKKLNVSNGAIIASIIGGFLGALIGVPVVLVGAVLGLLLGVFLGAFLYEVIARRDPKMAVQVALATFFSRVVALFVKTSLGFIMVFYLLVKAFI